MACLLHTEYSPGNTQPRRRSESPRIVWQPASHFLQGSSIVPERGKICPGAAALAAPNPRRTPSVQCQEKWLSATWNRGHHLPEKSQSQMGWAHETRRVRLYATRLMGRRVPWYRGAAISEIFKCHPRLDVLWVMCYGCLPPVCASLDSSAYCVYQDLRLVSPPLGESHRGLD